MRLQSAAVSLLLFSFLAPLSVLAATISGTVREKGSGRTLASMSVAAYGSSGTVQAAATTGTSGNYSLQLPAGEYRLVAWDNAGLLATSFYDGAESFDTAAVLTLTGSAVRSGIDFALERGGRINGRIAAASEGTALSGVTVAAYNESGTLRGTTVSDSSGTYSILLPPGSYRLAAWDDQLRYAFTFWRATRQFEAADRIPVAADQTIASIDFSLELNATISGKVRSSGGAELSMMQVGAWEVSSGQHRRTATAPSGNYSLALEPGIWRFAAWDSLGDWATSFYGNAESFDTSLQFQLGAGETRSGLDYTMTRAARVEGIVVAAESGAPLSGITVTLWNLSGTLRSETSTSTEGRYSLTAPAGEFKLSVHDDRLRFLTLFHQAASSFAGATALQLAADSIRSLEPLQMERGGVVAGRVVRAGDGSPQAAISVSAHGLDGSTIAAATTGSDGSFELLLPAGSWKLSASDPAGRLSTSFWNGSSSFEEATTIGVIAGGRVDDLLFSLSPNQTLRKRPARR
jgi:hypothetical protein